MKKTIIVLMALCMLVMLVACNAAGKVEPTETSDLNLEDIQDLKPSVGNASNVKGELVPMETVPKETLVPIETIPNETSVVPIETIPPETTVPPEVTAPPKTEPEVTEPPAVTEAPVAEVVPGDPNRVYHTEWGTRPYEFEEVCRDVVDETFMFVMHWDRYGNIWYDHEDAVTTGHGKSIWQSFNQMPAVPAYFGYGRWSNFGVCWDEDGFSGGTTDWRWGYGYYYPSYWGDQYECIKNPCPIDYPVWVTYENPHTLLAYLEQGGEARELVKNRYSLTDEQVEMILQDPTTFPIPDSGYYG